MGEPIDRTTQAHPPTPTPALSFLLSEKALEATRTEILVLASGILFLASPVFLLVWILCRVGGQPAVTEKEERKVSIVLPTETEPSAPATDDDAHSERVNATGDSNVNSNEDTLLLRLRRSSTWGGRSAQPGSRPRERRKSAGTRRKVYASDDDGNEDDPGYSEKQRPQTSLSSPGPELGEEPQPEIGHAALTAFGEMGRVAAALATPATLLLPSGGGGGSGREDGAGVHDGGDEATELSEFDARRAASIEKPPSPRSPRVLAADQAAMMDALCAEDGEDADWKAAVPSPVGGDRRDSLDPASGFDDPLGVNKLVGLPAKDEQRPEVVELELRNGGRRIRENVIGDALIAPTH